MSVAERFRDLINATQRYALELGIKLSLDAVPDERQFPIVFLGQPAHTDGNARSHNKLVFLFVPGASLLTSDVLADVIRRIMHGQDQYCGHVLLFAEEDLRLLKRTLDATGLGLYCSIHPYSYRNGRYESSWTQNATVAAGIESI